MKVLLLQNIDKIGHKGDVVDVAPGFARNALIARRLAQLATPQIIQQFESRKKHEEAEMQHKKERVSAVAQLLEKETLLFKIKTGKNNEVFSSVHDADILSRIITTINTKIPDAHFTEKDITLETKPIKELGIKKLPAKVGRGDWAQKITLTLEITAE